MESKNKTKKTLMGREAEKWGNYLWEKFLDRLAQSKSKKELQQLLEQLISEDEKKMILRRLAVIALVGSGKSYREIGEILWISHQTISTIKKNIFGSNNNYKSYRKFYKGPTKWSGKTEVKKPFLEDFLDFIGDLGVSAGKFFTPRGIGILSAWDVKEYQKRFKK